MPFVTRIIHRFGVLVFFLFLSSSLWAQNFTYTQSFETSNPFQFWSSNATYKINYFGPSGDRAASGTKSLKMDITVNGSGTKECYYYWILPVKTNLIGTMDLTAKLWMSSETAKYVSLGYHYAFPPTNLERTPLAPKITTFNAWFNYKVNLAEDVIYHADYFAKNKIYGSTYTDFGREITFLQLIIKAVGSKRLVFYIDNIQVKGTVLTPASYETQYKSNWSKFKTRLSSLVADKKNQYNNLAPIPGTSGTTLTAKIQEYLNTLNKCKSNISTALNQMSSNTFFAPEIMENCESHLEMYPSYWQLLKTELSNPGTKLGIYSMHPTKYSRVTGSNIPNNLGSASKLSARMCAGEFEPFSLFLMAKTNLSSVKVSSTSLTGASGTISSSEIDISIAKVWYQKGYEITGHGDKWLTQELLVKNDNLIKVDEVNKTNSLLVQKSDGTKSYIVISNPGSAVPRSVKIKHSDVLLPFNISVNKSKLLWITVHIPASAAPGKYTGKINLSSNEGALGSIPVEIDVLPITLEKSILDYAIYYHGYVDNWNWQERPFTSFGKNSIQYEIEMRDLKNHGVLYPSTYQTVNALPYDLRIRDKVGFPKDRIFSNGLITGNPQTTTALSTLKSEVTKLKNRVGEFGYQNLYVYGIDEASGTMLTSQRKAWEAVHQAGAKVFAAGWYSTFSYMGDILDLGVIQNTPHIEQSKLYNSVGHEVYSYRNPMVGVEDPEAYRKNYGYVLWKAGYDGTMNYAYQREFGDIWNDFDIETNQPHPYRDHCFTYPVTDGVIGTVQWEGFREAVDDIRYLSTLIKKINTLKSKGVDVTALQSFVNSIDPASMEPDEIRNGIIDRLLGNNTDSGTGGGGTDVVSFTLNKAVITSPTTVTLSFSQKIYSGIGALSNFTINNGITVYKTALSSDQTSVTLTTSAHKPGVIYTVSVKNLKDINRQLISAGSSAQYSLPGEIARNATEGSLAGGAALKLKSGSISAKAAYCATTSSTIRFTVTIPKAANYYIWGRFFFEGGNNSPNSFFVNVDNKAKLKFGNNLDYYNRWHWGGDGNKENGVPGRLALGWLSAGQHIITVSGREPGARVMLDMILLTSNSSYVPTDAKARLLKENPDSAAILAQQLPDSFELMQNYPNPFNPTTRIRYALPENTFVNIKVYDILGKEVMTLVNDFKEAGYYEAELNAANLPSGIYIYNIRTKQFAQSKKMMLVK